MPEKEKAEVVILAEEVVVNAEAKYLTELADAVEHGNGCGCKSCRSRFERLTDALDNEMNRLVAKVPDEEEQIIDNVELQEKWDKWVRREDKSKKPKKK